MKTAMTTQPDSTERLERTAPLAGACAAERPAAGGDAPGGGGGGAPV